MNITEEYPDFFGDAPLYSAECLKNNIHIRGSSYVEILTFEASDIISHESNVIIKD